MPVPTWLATEQAEPKLPARVRPGWAPRPDRKVQIVRGWAVPEGAGQDESPSDISQLLGRTGGWAADAAPATAPTPQPTPTISGPSPQPAPPTVQYTPDEPLQAQRHQTEASSPTGPSLGQQEDMYASLNTPAPSSVSTNNTSAVDNSASGQDFSKSGSALGPGPQSKTKGDWIDQARQAAIDEGLDPDIFARQIQQESGFNPGAKSPAGAIGIAQIMPDTAKSWGVDPTDAKASLKAAARADAQYLKDYGGDYRMMLAAYNAGPGAVAKYGGVPPYAETQSYVQAIYGSGSSKGAPSSGGPGSGGGSHVLGSARSQVGTNTQRTGLLQTAQSAIGSQYQFGGAGGRNDKAALSPTDCSGFVSWAYQQGAGIKLPAQTKAIWDSTTAIDAAQARPGDLVMYNMDQSSDHLQHVGIYVGNGQMIHDSSTNPNGGVAVTPLWSNPSFRRVPGATTEQLQGIDASSTDQPASLSRPPRDRVTSWAVVAHGGRQMLMGQYASGKPLIRDLGKTTKPDGTLISHMTQQASSAVQQQQAQDPGGVSMGAGQEAREPKPSGSPLEQALQQMIEAAISKRLGAGQDEGDSPDDTTDTVLRAAQEQAARFQQAAAVAQTPGGGYEVPTNADVTNLGGPEAVNAAAIPGRGYQVPTNADVVNVTRKVAAKANVPGASDVTYQDIAPQPEADAATAEPAPEQPAAAAQPTSDATQPQRKVSLTDPSSWVDLGPSAIEATKAKIQTPDDQNNVLLQGAPAGSPNEAISRGVGQVAGTIFSGIGTAASTALSPFGSQSEQYPTGGPAAGPVYGVGRNVAGYEQLANENPEYAALTNEENSITTQLSNLPGNPAIMAEQPGPDGDNVRQLQARIKEIDARKREIQDASDNVYELAARNPNIGSYETQAGITQGVVAAGVGGALGAAGAPALVKSVAQTAIDPLTGLPSVGGDVAKLAQSRMPAQASVDFAAGGVPSLVSRLRGGAAEAEELGTPEEAVATTAAAGKKAAKTKPMQSQPAPQNALDALTQGGEGTVFPQLDQPVKQLFTEPGQKTAFQYQLKSQGIPDVVTAYAPKGTAAEGGTRTLSLQRPALAADDVEAFAVPRDNIVGLGNPRAAEIVANTKGLKKATTAERYLANNSQLQHAITGPVSRALDQTLAAPVTDEERAVAQRFLDENPNVTTGARARGEVLYPQAQTADGLALLMRQLRVLADQGAAEKDWYTISSRKILQAAGGNRQDAETIAKLVAIYSNNTPVSDNLDNALTAWSQWKAGKKVMDAPNMGVTNQHATDLLNGKAEWTGIKTNNFYRNLMKEIDPAKYRELGLVKDEKGVAQTGATIDIWMQRALNAPLTMKSPGNQQRYDFAAKLVSQVGLERGWSPEQAQAAIWTATKNGWEKAKTAESMAESGYNYGTALVERTAAGWGIDEKTAAVFRDEVTGQDRVARTVGLLGEDGNVALPQARQTRAGADIFFQKSTGRELSAAEAAKLPAWDVVSPVGRVAEEARKQIEAYTAFRAKLTGASEAGWARVWQLGPKEIKGANASVIDAGRPLSNAEIEQLQTHLDGVIGPGKTKVIRTNQGGWVLGREGTAGTSFLDTVDQGISTLESEGAATTHAARYDGEFHTNDWSTHPNGESYQSTIEQSGARYAAGLRELESVLRPQIDAARATAQGDENAARALASQVVEAPKTLAPAEREAAIRDALPAEIRDTRQGQAIVKQVAAASDPGPTLQRLQQSRGLSTQAVVEHMTGGNLPATRAVSMTPHTAAEQADLMQRAALELNDQKLLSDSRAVLESAKHEPLSPAQLRTMISDAVRRANPDLSAAQLTRRVGQILRSRSGPALGGRQPGFAATGYALRLAGGTAGGVAGGELAAQRTPQDDPERTRNILIGAAVGGAFGLGLPYLAGFIGKHGVEPAIHTAEERVGVAPIMGRSPGYQALHQELTGGVQSATLAGQLFTEKLDAAFRGQLNADEVAYWELHNSVSPKWQGNPAAVAAFKEWQDIADWAATNDVMSKTIDFSNPANRANLYVPHVLDADFKAAQQVMPTSDFERATGGYSGLRQNPFWAHKQTRQFQTMDDGVKGLLPDGTTTKAVKYTDDQAKSLGLYYAKALQEKALQQYADGVAKLADKGTFSRDGTPELWKEDTAKKAKQQYDAGFNAKSAPGKNASEFRKQGYADQQAGRPQYTSYQPPAVAVKSGTPLNAYLPGRLRNVQAGPGLSDVLETTFGKTSGVNAMQLATQKTLGAFGALKHNMFGLSGFHGLNVTRQFGTSLPAMYAQRGILGSTSSAARYARFAAEVPFTPVRFAQEMTQAVSHVATPGAWRAFKLRETPGMLEASRDGLTLNFNTQHAMSWKRQVGVSLFNAVGGGAAGYGFGQSQNMSQEDSLKLAALGFIGGAATGAHIPGTGASLITHVNDALFSRYIPYLKYRTWQLLKPSIGGRAAAEYANMSLGGQNLMAIARSRSVQDTARLAGLAPDFEEGVAKQWGNAIFNWHGPQGTMNRMYHASALVGSAFMLEAGNQLFSGHWSWDNDPSATLEWDMSGLYDKLGWKHTDPVTGQNYRPYFDFMGPWRGQYEALQELGRASALGAMQLYNIQPPDEIAGSVQKGIPHPDPQGAIQRLLSARAGLLPRSAVEFASGHDYAGRSVEVAGDPAMLNVGRRFVNAMQGALPTGPTQAIKGLETGQQGWGQAILSGVAGTVGFRTARVAGPAEGEADIATSSSRRMQMLDQWMKDNGVTPEQQQFLQDQRVQKNLEVTNAVNALLADSSLTPDAPAGQARSAGLISQVIAAQQGRVKEYDQLLDQLNQRYGGYDPKSGKPPPPGYEEQADDLKMLFGGVIQGGTSAAADLSDRPDLDANQLYQMAWTPQSTTGLPQQLLSDLGIQAPDWLPNVGAKIDPKDQRAMAKEHATAVEKVATDWDVDPSVMQDIVKSHLYGNGQLPPLPGMSSRALDDVASQYWDISQKVDSGPDRTQQQQKVISDAAAAYGVDPNNLRDRVVWRGLPMTEQPEALKTYGNATGLDSKTQVYSFANPDGTPWGTLPQEKQATQILQAARKQGRYVPGKGGFPGTYLNSSKTDVDPKLQAIAEAQSRGSAARATALQNDPNYAAYDRYYNRGKYLTNDQWQQFQAGTLPGAFADIGTQYPNEFKHRIDILNQWAKMTPEQRKDPNQPENVPLLVQDPYTGQLSRQNVTMAYAAGYYLTNAKSAGKLQTGTAPDLNPDEAAAGLPGG